MKKILIYGINQQAQQLYHYIMHENERIVSAFVVDGEYKSVDELLGLPVYCFEEIESVFSVDEYEILLSFGYKNMVRNRQEKYNLCKEKGYALASYISKAAKVYTDQIGESVIIYPNTIVAPFVTIGDGCFIETSCTIAHHTSIGSFSFLAPGVTISGDVKIGNNCFLGCGSIVSASAKIDDLVVVGAGVCVTNDLMSNTAFRHNEAIQLSKNVEDYI